MAFLVKLNIYDLSQGMAKSMSKALTGKQIDLIPHTGIVVYDKEFYYGGGISYDVPGMTPFGRPTETREMGITDIPEDQFMEILKDMAPRFSMQTYDVMKHNCNNFTDEVCEVLLGHGIPEEITGLPAEFLATPLGQSLKPMMDQMGESLKVQSNSLFNEEGGQNELQARPEGQPGIMANPM